MNTDETKRSNQSLLSIVVSVVLFVIAPLQTSAASSSTTVINVFAASSLASTFEVLVTEFHKVYPTVEVKLNTGGSSTLLTQIKNGAPADVFAVADSSTMDAAVKADLIHGQPMVFARNTLVIVVAKGNPKKVKTLKDLSRKDLIVALGAPGVPIGEYSRAVLAKSKVVVQPKTLEASVSGILTKVSLGEVDAGIVYVTDVATGASAKKVEGVAIAKKQNTIATYPVALTRTSKNKQSAELFTTFLLSSASQKLLARAKFLPA
jgi:molybdate transport system substrate-binding protein